MCQNCGTINDTCSNFFRWTVPWSDNENLLQVSRIWSSRRIPFSSLFPALVWKKAINKTNIIWAISYGAYQYDHAIWSIWYGTYGMGKEKMWSQAWDDLEHARAIPKIGLFGGIIKSYFWPRSSTLHKISGSFICFSVLDLNSESFGFFNSKVTIVRIPCSLT